MDVEVATLFVESAGLAVSLLGEVRVRRGSDLETSMIRALQSLDLSTALAQVSDLELAGLMKGAMSAREANLVLADPQIRRLMSEMMLAAIVEGQDEAFAIAREMVRGRAGELLRGEVAADDADFFINSIVERIAEYCEVVLQAARTLAPGAVIGVQHLASSRRMQSILERIAEQSEAISRALAPENKNRNDEFVSNYLKLCSAIHGKIQPPDFETNQKIALSDLYVLPRIDRVDQADVAETIPMEQFIDGTDRTVILGDPGGGKSTLSNYLMTHIAEGSNGIVPFHVTLREFAPSSESVSIVQFIESQLPARYQIEPPAGIVADSLLSGQSVVIFDGLDELIDPTKRRAMTSAVEAFGIRYPMARIVVTSRRVGYEQARLDPEIFRSHHISGFTSEDVAEYVRKWFAAQNEYSDPESKKLAHDFIAQSSAVSDLSSNPLMLSLMCIIFRGENFIPKNRPAIYEKCATLLFEKWDGHRQIEVPLQARDYVDAAMKHIAYVYLLSESTDTGIPRDDLIREMTAYLFPRAMDTRESAERAAEEFVDFCAGRAWVFSDAGTTAEGEPIFTFTHRTFMEYFAAVHLTRITDTPEKLARTLLPKIAQEQWDVVAQLAIQQCDKSHDKGTERALRVMLEDPRRRSEVNRSRILRFIVRCCEFAVIPPSLVKDISAATVTFYLDNASGSDEEMHLTQPWFAVIDQLPEDHVASAIEGQRERLLTGLALRGGPRFEHAIYLLLLGLLRRFNGRVWKANRREDLINDAFTDLGASQLSSLEPLLEKHPRLWALLILGAVVSPEEGLRHLKDARLSFFDLYYCNAWEFGRHSEVSLAGAMNYAFGQTSHFKVVRDAELLTPIAESYLTDFWIDGPPHESRDTPVEFYPSIHLPQADDPTVTSMPQIFRDALLVTGLTLIELEGENNGRFPLNRPQVDAADLRRLDISERARRFAEDWLSVDIRAFLATEMTDG